jgi:hypothetical protein
MNTKMLKLARRLWNVPGCPRELNRANARKWVRSLRTLGDHWLLARPVEKRA